MGRAGCQMPLGGSQHPGRNIKRSPSLDRFTNRGPRRSLRGGGHVRRPPGPDAYVGLVSAGKRAQHVCKESNEHEGPPAQSRSQTSDGLSRWRKRVVRSGRRGDRSSSVEPANNSEGAKDPRGGPVDRARTHEGLAGESCPISPTADRWSTDCAPIDFLPVARERPRPEGDSQRVRLTQVGWCLSADRVAAPAAPRL